MATEGATENQVGLDRATAVQAASLLPMGAKRPEAMSKSFVTVVEKSGDTKLSKNGKVSATWVSLASCPGYFPGDPNPCALMDCACYAQRNRAGITTRRLNAVADDSPLSERELRLAMAREEAEKIQQLTGLNKLRNHVSGDCTSNETASIVGSAMVAHEAKHGKAAWTYTHSADTIDHAAWNGARVLASCQTVEDVRRFRAKGYGTALIVPEHPTHQLYQYEGETIVPCPAQINKTVTCEFCTLCQRPDWLRENKISVGFQPDSGTAKPIAKIIALRKVA